MNKEKLTYSSLSQKLLPFALCLAQRSCARLLKLRLSNLTSYATLHSIHAVQGKRSYIGIVRVNKLCLGERVIKKRVEDETVEFCTIDGESPVVIN